MGAWRRTHPVMTISIHRLDGYEISISCDVSTEHTCSQQENEPSLAGFGFQDQLIKPCGVVKRLAPVLEFLVQSGAYRDVV
jgi:hypothetical protein